MRLFAKAKMMATVGTILATFSAATWAQNLRVMGTTTGEGPAYFNGASTFGGPATFRGSTTSEGPAYFNGPSSFGGQATFQNSTTCESSATFKAASVFGGPATFWGTVNSVSPITMTSPDSSNIYPISLDRTGEDGRRHVWRFWHMNGPYSDPNWSDPNISSKKTGALHIWEYHADSNSNWCGPKANSADGDGDVCANRLTIAPGGNVGIGEWFPAYKLDVVGDIHAAGDTYANGSLASDRGLSVGYGRGGGAPVNGAAIAGAVSIGHTAPTQALDVNGRIRAREGTIVYQSACGDGALTLSQRTPSCCSPGEYGTMTCTAVYQDNTPVGRLVDF